MIKFLTSTLHNELAKECLYFKPVPNALRFLSLKSHFILNLQLTMGKGCGPLNRWSLYSINRWHAAACYILEQSNFWSFGLLPLDPRRRQAQKANSRWSHSQLSTRIFFVSSEHSTGNVHPQKVEAFFEPGRNRDPLKNQDPPSNKTTFERSRGIWQTTRVILCRFSFYEYLMNLLNESWFTLLRRHMTDFQGIADYSTNKDFLEFRRILWAVGY